MLLRPEKSDCMVDNIHLEKYAKNVLNSYNLPFQSEAPMQYMPQQYER